MPLKKRVSSTGFMRISVNKGMTGREKPGDYVHMQTYEQAEKISWTVFFFPQENLSNLKAHQMVWYGYECLNLSRERDEMLTTDKLEEDRRFINLLCSELHMFNKLMTIQPPTNTSHCGLYLLLSLW